jgi:hypothetical protein
MFHSRPYITEFMQSRAVGKSNSVYYITCLTYWEEYFQFGSRLLKLFLLSGEWRCTDMAVLFKANKILFLAQTNVFMIKNQK